MGKHTHEGLRDLDKDPDDSWTISFGGLSGRISKPTAVPVSPDNERQASPQAQATDPWKERWLQEHGRPLPPEPPSSDEDELSYRRDPRKKPQG
jgi:hypothetical protein